jgi:hypothetical protein
MKKTASIVMLISALLTSAIAGAFDVKLGKANPFYEERWTDPPIILIYSPQNGTLTNNCLINFTVSKPAWWVGTTYTFNGLDCIIDGKYYIGSFANWDTNLNSPIDYSAYLSNLTDGVHNVTVNAYSTGFVREIHGLWDYKLPVDSTSFVYFTVDNTSPEISITSVENKTYYTSDLQLNFTVSEVFRNASYALDGQNVPLPKSLTLSDLPLGSHSLTVYAYDFAGNAGTSETVTFTIAQQEPFPTIPFLTVIVAGVVVAGAGFLLIRKRGRGKTQ